MERCGASRPAALHCYRLSYPSHTLSLLVKSHASASPSLHSYHCLSHSHHRFGASEKSSKPKPIKSYVAGLAAGLNLPPMISFHPKRPKNAPFPRYRPKTNSDGRDTRIDRKIQTAERNLKCRGSFGNLGPRGSQPMQSQASPAIGVHLRRVSLFGNFFGRSDFAFSDNF